MQCIIPLKFSHLRYDPGNSMILHHPELMYSEENATEFRGTLSKELSFG